MISRKGCSLSWSGAHPSSRGTEIPFEVPQNSLLTHPEDGTKALPSGGAQKRWSWMARIHNTLRSKSRRLHEGDGRAVDRIDDAGNQAALDGRFWLGSGKAVFPDHGDCPRDVTAHEREPPASSAITSWPYHLDDGLLEFEERLTRAVADLADALASNSERFESRNRVVERGRHHDDVLKKFHRVRIASEDFAMPLAARVLISGHFERGAEDSAQTLPKCTRFDSGQLDGDNRLALAPGNSPSPSDDSTPSRGCRADRGR